MFKRKYNFAQNKCKFSQLIALDTLRFMSKTFFMNIFLSSMLRIRIYICVSFLCTARFSNTNEQKLMKLSRNHIGMDINQNFQRNSSLSRTL